jgi:hypothetical protein
MRSGLALCTLCALLLLVPQCHGARQERLASGDAALVTEHAGTAVDGPHGLRKRGVRWGLTVAEIKALKGLDWWYNW